MVHTTKQIGRPHDWQTGLDYVIIGKISSRLTEQPCAERQVEDDGRTPAGYPPHIRPDPYHPVQVESYGPTIPKELTASEDLGTVQ